MDASGYGGQMPPGYGMPMPAAAHPAGPPGVLGHNMRTAQPSPMQAHQNFMDAQQGFGMQGQGMQAHGLPLSEAPGPGGYGGYGSSPSSPMPMDPNQMRGRPNLAQSHGSPAQASNMQGGAARPQGLNPKIKAGRPVAMSSSRISQNKTPVQFLGTSAEPDNLPARIKVDSRGQGGLRVSTSPRGSLSPPIADPDAEVMLVVRNTFFQVKEAPSPRLKVSRSDSELSCASDLLDSVGWGQRGDESPAPLRSLGPARGEDSPRPLPQRQAEAASPAAAPAASESPGVPVNSEDVPSVGSLEHASGNCHPCCFFRRNKCTLDKDCRHCHFPHAAQKHPGKKTRDRQKARSQKTDDGPN